MKRILQYAFNILLLEIFVLVSAFFPQYSGMFFFLYFIALMGVILLITGRSTRRIIKDLEELTDAEVILKVDQDTVLKLRAKDRAYKEEMGKQVKYQLMYFMLMIFLIVLFSSGELRATIFSWARFIVGDKNQVLLNFLQYQILYLIFFAFSFSGYRILGSVSKEKTPFSITVPSRYIVTTKGIIIDDRLPLKFPIEVKNWRVDNSRRFVELELSSHPFAAGGALGTATTFRLRLYSQRPRELWDVLKRYVKIREEQV